jgi:hypothetical protein
MTVPYIFASQTGNIALSELDANFANVKAAAATAGIVTGSAQPAITSVGQLTALTVAGNIRTLSGGVFAPAYYWANGVPFTSGSATSDYGNANVAAFLPTYNGALNNLAGNVTTTAAVNASTGIFPGLLSGGNVVGAQFSTNGVINASRTITGGNIASNGFVTGLTVTATAGGITAFGNVSGGNIITAGNVVAGQRVQASAFLTAGTIQGSDIYSTNVLRGANLIVSSSALISGIAQILDSTAATSTSSAAVTVTGGIAVGKNAYFGNVDGVSITHTGNILPGASMIYNLGSVSVPYSTFYGVATQSQYADLAENYQADRDYQFGTVVMFGGDHEVTVAAAATTAVAGVVSRNPAHLMNGQLRGPNVVPVALQGRTPCNVIGPVRKGDLLISAGDGYARSSNTPIMGQVIGKSLCDFAAEKGQIEIVVGRV